MFAVGLPWGSSDGKEYARNAGDPGPILGSERSSGEENGNPFQYSCLGNPLGQRSLVGCRPRGHEESNMTERLTLYQWLGLCALAAKDLGSIPGHGIKIPQAVRHGQINT